MRSRDRSKASPVPGRGGGGEGDEGERGRIGVQEEGEKGRREKKERREKRGREEGGGAWEQGEERPLHLFITMQL